MSSITIQTPNRDGSSLHLVPAEQITEAQFMDYFLEWKNHKEEIIPTSTDLGNCSFEEWKFNLKFPDVSKPKKLKPSREDLYFLVNDSDSILGAINVKYKLTPYLKINGGNIAYGVRFSERNKGYGRYLLKQSIEIWFKTETNAIQVACFSDNTGSRKIIESCGGELNRRKNTRNGEKLIYAIKKTSA